MQDYKYPKIYNLLVKRGVKYSERRVELYKDSIKYFQDKLVEPRFGAFLTDCNMEKKFDDKAEKFRLKLTSKTNQFPLIRFKHSKKKILQQLYDDFIELTSYKSIMNTMQSQTFIFDEEALPQTSADNLTTIQSDIDTVLNTNWDGATEISRIQDFTKTNQVDDMKQVFVQLSPLRNSVQSQFNPNSNAMEKNQKASVVDLFIQEPVDDKKISFKNFDSRTENRQLLENVKNVIEYNWNKVKFEDGCHYETNQDTNIDVDHTQDKYNIQLENKDKYTKALENISEKFDLFSGSLEQFILYYLAILTLMAFTISYTAMLSMLTIIGLAYKIVLSKKKSVSDGLKERDDEKVENSRYYKDKSKDKNAFLKVTNVFNEKLNDILTVLTQYKTFKDWNTNLATVDYQESKAKYSFIKSTFSNSNSKTKEELFELKNIKRKVFYFKARIILVVEFDDIRKSILKFYTLIGSTSDINQTQVSLYINCNHEYDDIFFESQLKSLDLLSSYIKTKAFSVSDTNKVLPSFEHQKLNALYTAAEQKLIFKTKQLANEKKEKLEREEKEKKSSFERVVTIDEKVKEECKQDPNNLVTDTLNTQPEQQETIELNKDLESEREQMLDNPKLRVSIVTRNNKRDSEVNDIRISNEASNPNNNQNLELLQKAKLEYETLSSNCKEIIKKKYVLLSDFLRREWTLWEEQGEELKLYYNENANGQRAAKAEVTINKPIKDVFNFLSNRDNHLKFNPSIEYFDEIKRIDDRYSIQYIKYKEHRGVTSRDFVLLCYSDFSTDKGIFFQTSHVDSKLDSLNRAERGTINFGGFRLKKISDTKTTLVYLIDADFKLVDFISNSYIKKYALATLEVKRILESEVV